MKTTVYRYYDSDGRLLYIGVTKNLIGRQEDHNQTRPWWPEVASASFIHFDTRQEALDHETAMIGIQWPKYNKAGPVLPEQAKEHLLQIVAGDLDDEEHRAKSDEMAEIMEELNQFSQKPETHKVLFAFGESIKWDDEGEERLIFCNRCQEIVDSRWFKSLFETIHIEVCDESAGR